MKHIFTSTLIAICFTSFSQEADTLHVPQETSSLQEAIDLVSDGGVIVLGEGTYEHGQTFVVDHKSITIQGCCSAEDVVLSGSNSHRVLDIFGDEDHEVVVQNLTIAFGRPGSDDHASALKVHDCQATFSQVIIENNGGGTGNTVAYGSGRESTLFERCIVRNNSVENYAGLRSSTARKCILHGNGGWNNTAVLLDCESYNCTVFGNGGGVHASGLSGGTAKNCVFWNNSAQSTYNPESVEYCLNSGHSGEGNIEGNPLFVDAGAGEFGLMPASPAVDSGDPNPIFNDADGSRNDMGAIALNEDFYVLAGCTDPLSCNYNSDVEEDDGSCLPYDALSGCVDETACNFNVDALCSDESCVYPLIAEDCESGSIACAEGTNWDATLQQCVPIESPTPCGEGTYWDDVNEECVILMPSDTDFDGCVGMTDLLDLLSTFGTCVEIPWTCGATLEYQGYDYETVQIGEQCWFAENLKSQQFSNGEFLDELSDNDDWVNATSSAYSVLDQEFFYNGFTTLDNRGICPAGWSPGSNSDWSELADSQGGASIAGTALKDSSSGGTNDSGFAGLMVGYRTYWDGEYLNQGSNAYFWTTTTTGNGIQNDVRLSTSSPALTGGPNSTSEDGFSIRCIQDSE